MKRLKTLVQDLDHERSTEIARIQAGYEELIELAHEIYVAIDLWRTRTISAERLRAKLKRACDLEYEICGECERFGAIAQELFPDDDLEPRE